MSTLVLRPQARKLVLYPQGRRGPAGPPRSSGGANASAVAGVNISGDRAVAFRESDGLLIYADSSDTDSALAFAGISLNAAVDGDVVTYQKFGVVTANFWTWTPGPVFLGLNGQLTQSPPTTGVLLAVGWAIDATSIDLKPSTPFLRN